MYRLGNKQYWEGRKSSGVRELWHQVVEGTDLKEEIPKGIVFLGFCSDVGVARNYGRIGASEGPNAIRKAMANFAVHFDANGQLSDGGDVVVSNKNLEASQEELAQITKNILQQGSFPILLGGGHEISYAHGKGVIEAFPLKKVGMINFDPHFDLRTYPQGAHSGSWARQLLEKNRDFHYLPIGINPAVNVAPMFDFMKEKNQTFISMEELLGLSPEKLLPKINAFIEKIDVLCLTVDLDVFSAGIAPGVSMTNPEGAFPYHIKPLITKLIESKKLVSLDIAEMNPLYDDGRTAKLAAYIIYGVVEGVSGL